MLLFLVMYFMIATFGLKLLWIGDGQSVRHMMRWCWMTEWHCWLKWQQFYLSFPNTAARWGWPVSTSASHARNSPECPGYLLQAWSRECCYFYTHLALTLFQAIRCQWYLHGFFFYVKKHSLIEWKKIHLELRLVLRWVHHSGKFCFY